MSKRITAIAGLTTASALYSIECFSAKLAATTELKKLHDYIILLTKESLQLDCSTLLLLDQELERLVVRASLGFPGHMVDSFVLRKGQGLPNLAARNCRVETVEDFHRENRFEISSLPAEFGIRSAIAAPMMAGNRVFGVLIGHTLERRVFTETEKQVYQIMANQAGMALSNSTLTASFSRSEEQRKATIRELHLEKEKRRELNDEFESIFATITIGVMQLKNGRYLARCNDKLAEILGYTSARQLENVSARRFHMSDKAYREFGEKYYGDMAAGEVVQTEFTLKKRDGSPVLCRLTGRSVDQSNPPDPGKGFVWLIDDISRRREMEEEILQARKLESIGILAGGIGHDYNNILSVILGNLGLAQRILEPGHNVQELISSALEAATKAKELTAKLLVFTRHDTPSLVRVRLQDLFKEFRFERLLRKEIDLAVDFQQGLFPLKIMPDHLKVILQNLLLNADGCMPDGGKITITGHNVEVLEEDVPGLSSGKYVEIAVADSGCGIEEAIVEKIFDPYFTTKNRDSSRGIGLGLAIVQSIVKKSHGNITVRSSKLTGTVFTVLIPAVINDFKPFNR